MCNQCESIQGKIVGRNVECKSCGKIIVPKERPPFVSGVKRTMVIDTYSEQAVRDIIQFAQDIQDDLWKEKWAKNKRIVAVRV